MRPFFGTLCNSMTTIELFVFCSSSFGKYNVIWGPTNGQYRPKLKPFINMKPLLDDKLEEKKQIYKLLVKFRSNRFSEKNDKHEILNLAPFTWINIHISDFILSYIKCAMEYHWTGI